MQKRFYLVLPEWGQCLQNFTRFLSGSSSSDLILQRYVLENKQKSLDLSFPFST